MPERKPAKDFAVYSSFQLPGVIGKVIPLSFVRKRLRKRIEGGLTSSEANKKGAEENAAKKHKYIIIETDFDTQVKSD